MTALWILLRPRLVPYLLLLPFFGWAFAHWDRALPMQGAQEFLAVMAAWVLLHAGTMWLNAALDRDEGEVLMGRAVPPPPFTTAAAYVALALCVPVAALGSTISAVAALGCAALAIAYSHPRLAWKGHAWLGPLVNFVGYGLLSPLAGWGVAGVPSNPRTLVCWGLFAVGILAPFFAAQAFQGEEDRGRGYQTFVVVHGARRTLQMARLCFLAVMFGGMVLAAVGWIPRVCLVGIGLWYWVDRLLAQWAEQPGGGSSGWAMRFARRTLLSASVIVIVCMGEYVRASLAREPVAGLGTAAGHPSDRPRLPPFELRHWELRHGIIYRGEPGATTD